MTRGVEIRQFGSSTRDDKLRQRTLGTGVLMTPGGCFRDFIRLSRHESAPSVIASRAINFTALMSPGLPVSLLKSAAKAIRPSSRLHGPLKKQKSRHGKA